MTIVAASAGRAATATALVTVAAMVAAFRPDGIALDRPCVLRATTIMLIRATADLSTERDMPIRAASLMPGGPFSLREAGATASMIIISLRTHG